jgi:uncharacterized protein with HEPN domain
MQQPDLNRLRHMLDSAEEAITFTVNKSSKDLDHDRILTPAIIKAIEIIGEAALRVSESCRSNYPVIPWKDIINMRHRMIHAYFDVNLDIVWQTFQTDLPSLVEALEGIIPPEQK